MPFKANNQFIADKYSDAEVIRAFVTDNMPVVEWWYKKCRIECMRATSYYNYITNQDRKDLFHETLLLVWEKISMGLITARGDEVFVIRQNTEVFCSNFMGYVINILKYKYLEMLRSKSRIVTFDDVTAAVPGREELISELYGAPDPEMMKDLLVANAIGQLPKSCQGILYKFHYEGKSYETILTEMPTWHSTDSLKTKKSTCLSTLKKNVAALFKKAGL